MVLHGSTSKFTISCNSTFLFARDLKLMIFRPFQSRSVGIVRGVPVLNNEPSNSGSCDAARSCSELPNKKNSLCVLRIREISTNDQSANIRSATLSQNQVRRNCSPGKMSRPLPNRSSKTENKQHRVSRRGDVGEWQALCGNGFKQTNAPGASENHIKTE